MRLVSVIFGTAALVLPPLVAPANAQLATPEPSAGESPTEVATPLASSVDVDDENIRVEVPSDPEAVDPTPVLVRPAREVGDQAEEDEPAESAEVALDDPAADETERGLVVRVERISSPDDTVAAKNVKLFAPFAPKPLAPIPEGWQLRRPAEAVPFSREVDLGGGNQITLAILPFVLAPDDAPNDVFSIREPGYDPALQYAQLDTIGALLGEYTQQLEQSDARMSDAIERLNQLLLSFPQDLE